MTDLVELARDLRDRNMSLAERHQDSASPDWSTRARLALERLARRQPTVHIDDMLLEFTEQPEDHHAWGSVWRNAALAKVIEKPKPTEYRPCTVDPKKHAHASPVYRSLIYRRPS
jgi:hypothetical protein